MKNVPTLLFDYFLFTVDQRFESKSKSGIIMINESYIAGTSEEEEGWEKNTHKRVYGNVIACPKAFSDKQIFAIDPGLPNPKRYISGQEIENKVRWGMAGYSRADYSPTMYDGVEYITAKTISTKTDIQVGDRIYFDQKATDMDQYICDHDKLQVFRVRVDEIICVVRDGVIITQGGWVLVKPEMECWDEIKSEMGIIMKPRPEAKYLEGNILASDFVDEIEIGDHIYYHPDSDWPIKVEGEDCYAIQERDILAKIE